MKSQIQNHKSNIKIQINKDVKNPTSLIHTERSQFYSWAKNYNEYNILSLLAYTLVYKESRKTK